MSSPSWTGLIEPMIGRDACGVGFVLCRQSHRAACGLDLETGDGAGILIQLPERSEAARLGFDLAPNRRFAIGQMFLPPGRAARACETIVTRDLAQIVIELQKASTPTSPR